MTTREMLQAPLYNEFGINSRVPSFSLSLTQRPWGPHHTIAQRAEREKKGKKETRREGKILIRACSWWCCTRHRRPSWPRRCCCRRRPSGGRPRCSSRRQSQGYSEIKREGGIFDTICVGSITSTYFCLFGYVFEVLCVSLRQHHSPHPLPVGCQNLLLDPAHGKHDPPQGDLPGHRQPRITGLSVRSETKEVTTATPAEGPSLLTPPAGKWTWRSNLSGKSGGIRSCLCVGGQDSEEHTWQR